MAISTTAAHVSRAIDFFNKQDVFFAIGKTSAWPNDASGRNELHKDFLPPSEDKETTALTEVIGYKKVEAKHLVIQDPEGDIVYENSRWRAIPLSSAYTEGAKFVFLETTIRYDELPLGFYRQIGIYTGLVRNSGVSAAKANLIPGEVKDAGILEVLSNRQPSNRQQGQKETINIVIEF